MLESVLESVSVCAGQFEQIWAWLPSLTAIQDPRLLFSTVVDGYNLETLLVKAGRSSPLLLVVETAQREVSSFDSRCSPLSPPYARSQSSVLLLLLGQVFGAYITVPLKRATRYTGDRSFSSTTIYKHS